MQKSKTQKNQTQQQHETKGKKNEEKEYLELKKPKKLSGILKCKEVIIFTMEMGTYVVWPYYQWNDATYIAIRICNMTGVGLTLSEIKGSVGIFFFQYS